MRLVIPLTFSSGSEICFGKSEGVFALVDLGIVELLLRHGKRALATT